MSAVLPKYVENHGGGTSKRYSIIRPLISSRVTRARSKSVIHVSSKYESLDYDLWENELFLQEEQETGFSDIVWLNAIRWMLYLFIGVVAGLITVLVDVFISKLTYFRYSIVKYYLDVCSATDDSCSTVGYIYWYFSVIVPVVIGAAVVIFIEPSAAGSGLPSVISHLNGVRIPRFTKMKVFFTKIISVILVCSAGLIGGKEGPFIHLGSIIGDQITSALSHFKGSINDKIRYLSSNAEKRDFMAAGCAAGVSAAFGSPIGATLMILEEGTSFWSLNLMWRMFFCAIISSFTCNTIQYFVLNFSAEHTYLSTFYFGKLNESTLHYEYFELPLFIGVGVIGGLSGALFILIGVKIILLRDRLIKSKILKILDALAVAVLTVSLAVFSTYSVGHCQPEKNFSTKHALKANCEKGDYNEISVFWFHTHEYILRMLYHGSADLFSSFSLLTLLVIYFFLSVTLLGVNVSVGIFLPCLLVGAVYGRLIALAIRCVFPSLTWVVPTKYALLGAAANLGGVVRTTISLTVIIIEGTGAISFGFPLMITLFVAKWVGDLFTESLYETQINLLGIPILPNDAPPLTADITAKDVMNKAVRVFSVHVKAKHLMEVLQTVPHHGFPVVDDASSQVNTVDCSLLEAHGQLRGFILRSQLSALLFHKHFNPPESMDEIKNILIMFEADESANDLQNVVLTDEEKERYFDLSPYLHRSPYTILYTMSFPRIFRLFRLLGLRHVIVVNDKNEIVGIITRKDLAKLKIWRHATKMGLKELRVY